MKAIYKNLLQNSTVLLSSHTVFSLSVKQEYVVYIKRSIILVIRKIYENTDSDSTCKTVENPGTHVAENPPSRLQTRYRHSS